MFKKNILNAALTAIPTQTNRTLVWQITNFNKFTCSPSVPAAGCPPSDSASCRRAKAAAGNGFYHFLPGMFF